MEALFPNKWKYRGKRLGGKRVPAIATTPWGGGSLAQAKFISPALSSRGNPAGRSCALMGKGQAADLKDAH